MADGLFGTGTSPARIKQTQLRPAQVAGSTYVAPRRQESGGNLRALADALGKLNSSLVNYQETTRQIGEDPNSRSNKEYQARLQQMSLDELRQEAKSGSALGSRIRTDALETLIADRAVEDYRLWAQEYYNTDFDRATGNFAADSEAKLAEMAEWMPEVARGTFYQKVRPFAQSWAETDVKDKTATIKQEINTSIVTGFRNAIDLGIESGTPADEIAAQVFAMSADNRDFLGLSGQEQNETLLSIAEEYAQRGEVEVARALLTTARTGSDGREVPAISNIAGHATKALGLIERAQGVKDERTRKEGFSVYNSTQEKVHAGEFTEEDAKALDGSGYYTPTQLAAMVSQSARVRESAAAKAAADAQKRDRRIVSEREEARVVNEARAAMSTMGGTTNIRDVEIPSATGEGTTRITKEQIIDRAIQATEDEFTDTEAKMIAAGVDPEEARRQVNALRLSWYSGNKLPNERWATMLNGVGMMATLENLQDPEAREHVKAQVQLYRDLRAQNPAYLSTLLTDPKAREFLETYDASLELRQMPEDMALTHAASWVAMPDAQKAAYRPDPSRIENITVKTLRSLGVDQTGPNYAAVDARVRHLASQNLSEEQIKREITRWTEDTAVEINGVLVFDHRDLPPDFPDLVERQLQQTFEARGKEFGIESVDDLYITAESGESRWVIRSKFLGGMPIGNAHITPQTLETTRQGVEKEREERIRKLSEAKDAERAAAQKEFDDYVTWERSRIDYWRRRKGALSQALADRHERALDEYILRATPAEQERRRRETEAAVRSRADTVQRSLGGIQQEHQKMREGGEPR